MIAAPFPEYTDIIRRSHESHLRVTLYQESGTSPFTRTLIGEVPITSLEMNYDGRASVRRSANMTVALDPYETDSREVVEAISTEGGLMTIEHAVTYPGIQELHWVKIATMRIDAVSSPLRSAGREVSLYDRSILLQEHVLETPHPLNDTYVNLIHTMLNETLPGETLTVDPLFTSEELNLAPSTGKATAENSPRLKAMQEFADAIGGVVTNLTDGSFALLKVTDDAPVWTINAGTDGVLSDGTQEHSRREQYNAVSIRWEPNNDEDDWSYRIFLWDNEPSSPTYYDGPFGKRPVFYEEEYAHIPSQTEAERIARERLAETSGQTRGLTLTAVYNPLLEPGDNITVVLPSGETEEHIIDTINFSLAPTTRMEIVTRLVRTTNFGMAVTKNGRRIYG